MSPQGPNSSPLASWNCLLRQCDCICKVGYRVSGERRVAFQQQRCAMWAMGLVLQLSNSHLLMVRHQQGCRPCLLVERQLGFPLMPGKAGF